MVWKEFTTRIQHSFWIGEQPPYYSNLSAVIQLAKLPFLWIYENSCIIISKFSFATYLDILPMSQKNNKPSFPSSFYKVMSQFRGNMRQFSPNHFQPQVSILNSNLCEINSFGAIYWLGIKVYFGKSISWLAGKVI